MGYIYCITNLINGKQYVGKTVHTIEKRFQEHYRDSRKTRCKNRPIYNAIKKYGIENFKIDILEYVENNYILEEKEIYWIKKLDTYGKNGYNASKGGDGKILYNYEKIIELYNIGYSQKQISEKIGCCSCTVSKVLKDKNISIRFGRCKKIDQFDLDGHYIQSFFGSTKVAEWLVKNKLAKSRYSKRHITDCCNNKIHSAYGYIWKYSVL